MKEIILEIPNEVNALNIVACAIENDGSITFGGHSFDTNMNKIKLERPEVGSFNWSEEK